MAKNIYSKFEFIIGLSLIVIISASLFGWYLYYIGFSELIAWADSSISAMLLLFSGFLLSNVFSYYIPFSNKHLYNIGISILLAAAWLFITQYFLKVYFEHPAYTAWLQKSLPLRMLFGFQFLTALGFYNFLWQEQQSNTEMQSQQSSVNMLARDAELYKLRQQLQPHFLFNSLNSINALIGMEPKLARKMLVSLSDFLRLTLQQKDSELSSLQEELHFCNTYLDIEKIRFGNRLQTEIIIPEALNNMRIPNLILQPILENAIKYGLYNVTEPVCISINCSLQDAQTLKIVVANPYDDAEIKYVAGSGFGLKGIQRRLHLIYGATHLLQINKLNGVFTTTILIPQISN